MDNFGIFETSLRRAGIITGRERDRSCTGITMDRPFQRP